MSTINGQQKRSPSFWPRKQCAKGRGGKAAERRAFSMANCLAGDVPLDNCYVFDLPKSGSKNASNTGDCNWWQKVPPLPLLLPVSLLLPARPFRLGCSVQRPRSVRRRLRDLFHKQTAGKTARNFQRRCQITRPGQIRVRTHSDTATQVAHYLAQCLCECVCWQFALLHTS